MTPSQELTVEALKLAIKYAATRTGPTMLTNDEVLAVAKQFREFLRNPPR